MDRKIIKCLTKFELDATDRRVGQVRLRYNWEKLIYDEIDMEDLIQKMYNFRRVKNTRLAKKVIDQKKVVRYTENWIYIKKWKEYKT